MNKKLMIIWGMLVIIICLTLLLIGFSKKDKVLLKLERELKTSSKKYINDNHIKIGFNESYVIKINDLIDGNYIDDENIDEYCIKKIIVSKGIFLYEYEINKDCSDKEVINE